MIQMYGKNLDVEIVLFDKEAWGIAQEDFGDLLK